MADAKKTTAKKAKVGTKTAEYDVEAQFLKETQGGNTTLSDTLVAALRTQFAGGKRKDPVVLVGDVLTEPNAEQIRAGFTNPNDAPDEMRDGTASNTGFKKSTVANEEDPDGSQAVDDDEVRQYEPDAPKGSYSGQ